MQPAELYSLLDRSTEETLAAARALPPEALHTAAEGCWTPLQVLEHICLTEAFVAGMLQQPSEDLHPDAEVHGSSKLRHLIVGKRDIKRTAPERLQPLNAFTGLAAFEQRFTAQRDALKEAVASGRLALDHRLFPHPALGNMTVRDWLHFLVYHTERHVAQLKEAAQSAAS